MTAGDYGLGAPCVDVLLQTRKALRQEYLPTRALSLTVVGESSMRSGGGPQQSAE
jgi:hypothetical protein